MLGREIFFDTTDFENIKDLMYNAAKEYNNEPAFIIKHKNKTGVEYENISYAKFLEDINSLGTSFFDLGLQDKRIAIMGRNRYEWILTYTTNLMGQIVSVPLDKDLQIDELESSFIRSKADVVVFDEKFEDKIKEISARGNTNLETYICMGELEGYKNIKGLISKGEEFIEKGERKYLDVEIDSQKMAVLLFTSGTTAKSKAVMLNHRNIASNIYAIRVVEPMKRGDHNLAFLPFHHIFGSTGILLMLGLGTRTAFPDGLRYVAQNLKEYEVTEFFAVPLLVEAIYRNILKEVKKQGKEKTIKIALAISNFLMKFKIDIRRKLFKQIIDNLGGHLELIVSGGAALDKQVSKGLTDFGIMIIQGYGLTETSPVIAGEDIKYRRHGSIGRPMCNVELELANQDKDGIGEIKVKGPGVMLGYYENEEATNKVIKDGWFYTGDLAYFDKDGYLFITGRDKDMIVLKNGKKIFPEELETLVNRLDIVEECMVFGMPTEDNDVKLSVKIVYNEETYNENYANLSKEEFEKAVWEQIKEINQTLPRYKYMKNMILTDEELIKTTTKKVKRQEEMKKILKSD